MIEWFCYYISLFVVNININLVCSHDDENLKVQHTAVVEIL